MFFLIIAITSCNEKNNFITTTPADAYNKIIDLDSNYSQHFLIRNDTFNFIYGKQGTLIEVAPNTLESLDGKPCLETIEVELIELSSKADFINNNIQTSSNGKLLVSGGAYYINMTSKGKPVRLIKGKTIKVNFPKLTDEAMEYFYGVKDSSGQMNWLPMNKKAKSSNTKTFIFKEEPIEPKPFNEIGTLTSSDIEVMQDTVIKRKKLSDIVTVEDKKKQKAEYDKQYKKYKKKKADYDRWKAKAKYNFDSYEALDLGTLGWINVDTFLKMNSDVNQLRISIKDETFETARFYIVFRDLNSVMSQPLTISPKKEVTFKGIPEGYKIKIIGIGANENSPLLFSKDIVCNEETTVVASFQPVTLDDIKKIDLGDAKLIRNVYPNPFTSMCTIEFTLDSEYIIELITQSGDFVWRKEVSGIKYECEMNSISSGNYIIRVATKNGKQSEARQLVKQ